MVGCTRQSSFDAASFREAFRKNSHCTSENAMQEDQNILHHSLVNVLKIDTPQLVRSGSSGIPVLSSLDCSLDRGECLSIQPESVADGAGGVSLKDVDESGISMPLCRKGKAKFFPSDGHPGPSLKSRDHNGSGQLPETMLVRTIASRTIDPSTILSFRPLQLAAGINYLQRLQDKVTAYESQTNVLGGQMRPDTKIKAIHCRIHARDYSDCLPLHFNRPLHLSPHEAMMNVMQEALERSRKTSALALASPAEETGKVTAGSTSTSECDCRMKVCIAGDSDNRTCDNNAALLNCAGQVKPRQRPIRQEDCAGLEKKQAFQQSEQRKSEPLKENVASEEIVRRRTPVEFLIGYSAKNSGVGGCAVNPENSKCPIDREEDAKPSEDVNAKRLIHKWENRKIFVMAKDSRDDKKVFDSPLTVCGKTYRTQSPGQFAGKCEVWTTETSGNPLHVLGPDVILKVLCLLDARSLARCGVLSKDWKALAHLDNLWVSQCAKLWEGKFHLPCSALQHGLPKVVAYSRSVQDAKRTQITSKDLCDHIWEFRFTSAAPSYWLSLDPAQRGEAPMQRFFHMDGSQTAAPGDEVWGGHECLYSIVEEGTDGSVEHFVQINHWPYMSVSRTRDWGWVLNNRVHDYQSIPNAWKQEGTGPL